MTLHTPDNTPGNPVRVGQPTIEALVARLETSEQKNILVSAHQQKMIELREKLALIGRGSTS